MTSLSRSASLPSVLRNPLPIVPLTETFSHLVVFRSTLLRQFSLLYSDAIPTMGYPSRSLPTRYCHDPLADGPAHDRVFLLGNRAPE